MNIAVVSTRVQGGAGIAALRLHKAFQQKRGVSSVFVQKYDEFTNHQERIVSAPKKKLKIFDKVFRKLNLAVSPEQLAGRFNRQHLGHFECASFPQTSYSVEDEVSVKNADIINLHWVSGFLNYPSFFTKVKKPIVWTLHDMNPFQGLFHYKEDESRNRVALGKLDVQVLDTKIKALHKHPDIHVVCLGDWMKIRSQQSVALGRYPHYVIPNGLDFRLFPLLKKDDIKHRFGLDNGLKTLMFIAEDIKNPRKGFDFLKEALLNLNNHPFNLITIGGDNLFNGGQTKHIHHKKVEDLNLINQLYTAADLVVIPSREDNLPNVMLESFANGTPVLGFPVGGLKDWITPEVGLLAAEITYRSLLKELLLFLTDEVSFDAKKIRCYAEVNFNLDDVSAKYLNLFRDILTKPCKH